MTECRVTKIVFGPDGNILGWDTACTDETLNQEVVGSKDPNDPFSPYREQFSGEYQGDYDFYKELNKTGYEDDYVPPPLRWGDINRELERQLAQSRQFQKELSNRQLFIKIIITLVFT